LVDEQRSEPNFYLGSEFGLRIVAHSVVLSNQRQLQFTGISASLPYGPFAAFHEKIGDYRLYRQREISRADSGTVGFVNRTSPSLSADSEKAFRKFARTGRKIGFDDEAIVVEERYGHITVRYGRKFYACLVRIWN